MTYLEKYVRDHPEWKPEDVIKQLCVEARFPNSHPTCNPGYHDERCGECWNSKINEIPCDICVHTDTCEYEISFREFMGVCEHFTITCDLFKEAER